MLHTVQFKFIDTTLSAEEKNILLPKRQSTWASGFDLASAHRDDQLLKPRERMLVCTGIALALLPGFEGQVRSRSGLAINHGVIVLNAPGTIDADYRGEIKVIIANFSQDSFVITFGMRIAQLVIAPVITPTMREVKALDASDRQDAGFGSTGV